MNHELSNGFSIYPTRQATCEFCGIKYQRKRGDTKSHTCEAPECQHKRYLSTMAKKRQRWLLNRPEPGEINNRRVEHTPFVCGAYPVMDLRELDASNAPEAPIPERDVWCKYYDRCLDRAIAQGKTNWNCLRCLRYVME